MQPLPDGVLDDRERLRNQLGCEDWLQGNNDLIQGGQERSACLVQGVSHCLWMKFAANANLHDVVTKRSDKLANLILTLVQQVRTVCGRTSDRVVGRRLENVRNRELIPKAVVKLRITANVLMTAMLDPRRAAG